MLTLLCALAAGIIVGLGTIYGFHLTPSWGTFFGVLALLIVQVTVSLIVRRRTTKINFQIQGIMQEVQKKLEVKQQQFMRRPLDPKLMMQQFTKEQNAGLERAIEACELFRPLYKWSFLMERQINTMKMAFNYQLKRYDEADRLMAKSLLLDPQSIAMKMARMYKRNEEGLDKFFKKKCKGLKGKNCILPYSLYAWILVKQDKADEAFKVMAEAKKRVENEVIVRNWEALANKKPRSFSNAGLGEMWYALALEEPKMPKQQYRYR